MKVMGPADFFEISEHDEFWDFFVCFCGPGEF